MIKMVPEEIYYTTQLSLSIIVTFSNLAVNLTFA